MGLIVLTLDVFLLGGISGLAFIAGVLLQRRGIKKSRKRIYELEKEMLDNHSEILKLQRDKIFLLQKTDKLLSVKQSQD